VRAPEAPPSASAEELGLLPLEYSKRLILQDFRWLVHSPLSDALAMAMAWGNGFPSNETSAHE
jgi:hypothetical protein